MEKEYGRIAGIHISWHTGFSFRLFLMYYLFYLKTVEIAAWIKKYDSSRLVNSIVGGNHCVCCYVW